jgi:hypothetical protein
MRRLTAVLATAAMLAACAGAPTAVEPSAQPTVDARSSPTSAPTASPTERPTPTASPTATPVPSVDPELAFEVWQGVFADPANNQFLQSGEAIEEQFDFWVETVDQIEYDAEGHRLVFDITTRYGALYEHDPSMWHDQAWEFHRDMARELWSAFIEGFEEGMAGLGLGAPDWPRWIPTMVLSGDGGDARGVPRLADLRDRAAPGDAGRVRGGVHAPAVIRRRIRRWLPACEGTGPA